MFNFLRREGKFDIKFGGCGKNLKRMLENVCLRG